MIFGYNVIHHIEPFEVGNILAAFFLCRPRKKQYSCHKFLNTFQDDISCALAMYTYIYEIGCVFTLS